MRTEQRILTIFEGELRPGEQHAESTLGEEIDDLLGFPAEAAGAASSATTSRDAGVAAGWRDEPANYGSVAEQRLQALCDTCLAWLRDHYEISDAIHSDDICVRIVTGRSASPFKQSIADYHYIVLSAGYLKSLENLFRTQEHLAALGAAQRVERGDNVRDSRQRVLSNAIGGSDAEYALRAGTPDVDASLAALFNDVIIWSNSEGPYSYPEAMLTAMARMNHEMLVGGMYSSDGKPDDGFRAPATSRSRALTRLVAAYALCHELAHIVFDTGGDAPADTDTEERMCDLVATLYTPLFVQDFGASWQVRLNGGIEHIAGMLGFFMTTEVLEKAGLIVGLCNGTFKEGDAQYAELAQRIGIAESRRDAQFKLLRNLVGEAPDMVHLLDLARAEFSVLPIAVEMSGARLFTRRRSFFHEHFDRRLGNFH